MWKRVSPLKNLDGIDNHSNNGVPNLILGVTEKLNVGYEVHQQLSFSYYFRLNNLDDRIDSLRLTVSQLPCTALSTNTTSLVLDANYVLFTSQK